MLLKKWISHLREASCQIVELNQSKNTVVIQCKGLGACIKMTLEEIINDEIILSNVSSKHAAWIGYYFAKSCALNVSHLNFFATNSSELCELKMINRKGDLIYFDKQENRDFTISPIQAMISESLIGRFSSLQACYIGILAWMRDDKNNLKKPVANTFPRLVDGI